MAEKPEAEQPVPVPQPVDVQKAINDLKEAEQNGDDFSALSDDLDSLVREDVFAKALAIKECDPTMALEIVYIKNIMNELLSALPARMRGRVVDFSVYVKRAIEESLKADKKAVEVVETMMDMLHSVVEVCKHADDTVKHKLIAMYDRSPDFFDSDQMEDVILDMDVGEMDDDEIEGDEDDDDELMSLSSDSEDEDGEDADDEGEDGVEVELLVDLI